MNTISTVMTIVGTVLTAIGLFLNMVQPGRKKERQRIANESAKKTADLLVPAITKIFESLLGKSVSDSVKAQVSAATMATTATVVAEMTGAPFLGAGIIRRRSSMEPLILPGPGEKGGA